MKIGILTQPLHKNYGGLLQAFALQNVLRNLGHEVYTVDIPFRKTRYRKMRTAVSYNVRKYVFKQENIGPSQKELALITKNTERFKRENIQMTDYVPMVEKIHRINKYNFDAFIVGSDQVWRPKYSPGIPTYFLKFLEDRKDLKRLSYAASFGTDEWEFDELLTKECGQLAQKFDAISVREDSAVDLCKKHFGVDAEHLLDPTMLLEKEEYMKLVEKDGIPEKKDSLMLYVLDNSAEKRSLAEEVRNELSLTTNSVMPKATGWNRNRKDLEERIFPPVTEWIRGFMDAEFVITDSFHGTLFSILFNKPFISIANDARGVARFTSVLKMFGLEDRLVHANGTHDIKELLTPIDYKKVNKILAAEQDKAMKFLKNNL